MPTPLDPELVDQIRTSLYSGRGVRLSGNDAPTTMLEPSTALTAEGDAFLTSKLDKIAELLERGFVVNIDSQGAILAATTDHRSRYISTQETDIDVMDRIMVRQALEQGSKVSFERDGSLVIDAVADVALPSPAEAAARFAEFERLADSGQINSELADGREFRFDESAMPAMRPVQPVNAGPLQDPFDSAEELAAEAAALQLGVDAARELSRAEYRADKSTAETELLQAEQQLAMTTAERDTAERQAAAALADVTRISVDASAKREQAAAAREQGDTADAAAYDADAENFDLMAEVRSFAAGAAQRVLDEADGRIAEETKAVDRLTVASDEVNQEASRLETVFDAQEEQVFFAEKAAEQLAEAERLEAALPDLQARGVEGTERIEAAIAEHRAQAEALVQRGHLRDTTGITVTGDDVIGGDMSGDDLPSAAEPIGAPPSADGVRDVREATSPDEASPDEMSPAAAVEEPETLVEDPAPTDPGADAAVEAYSSPELPEPAEDFSDFQDDLGDAQQMQAAADSAFDSPMDLSDTETFVDDDDGDATATIGDRRKKFNLGYTIGIDLGTTFTAAALLRDGRTEVVALGNHAATIPSMVFLREDENVLIGDAAERRGMQEPARLAREFKRRLGDSVPILLDRTPYSAERLMAVMLRQIVADVSARQGAAPDRIAVSHPANWGQFKIDLLRQAVELAGLGAATFVTEPEAAAVQYASTERVEVGDVIAVYDLGGGTFDAAVLRKTATGFTTLGRPQGIERLGGIDFDEAVVAHVRRTVGDLIADLDVNDPATRAALARMRHECVLAKESLSSDSDATVPVMLPNVQTQVRITRSEFEDMIRPRLRDTIESTRRAVESAGVQLSDVKAVLLCGGSSRIPLVSELVRSELGRPVVTDSHPKHAVALGAARMAQSAAASPFVPPAPPSIAATAAAVAVAAAGVPVVSAPTPASAAPPTPPVTATAQLPVSGSQPVTIPMSATEALVAGPPPPASTSSGRGNSQWKLLVGGIAAVGLLVGVLVFALGGSSDNAANETLTTTGSTVATTLAVTVAPVTDPPTETVVTDPATTASEGTLGTAVTIAPEQRTCNETTGWCVGIISAEWGVDSVLRVNYETQGFVPMNTGVAGDYHVHFFWSSIPPDTVGTPYSGPWVVWDLNDGGGQYLFDGMTIDNFESLGYQWGDNLCIGVADHQHGIAGDLTAAGIGTYYCLPNTPTPSAG